MAFGTQEPEGERDADGVRDEWVFGCYGCFGNKGAPGREACVGFTHDAVANVAFRALGCGFHADHVEGDGVRRG